MRYLITGGAGFIGSNTAHKLLSQGHQVVIVDDLSRAGSKKNLDWLRAEYREISFHNQDIRDYDGLRSVLSAHRDSEVIIHLAAQVAVTTSVVNPREDFDTNALGTFNLLEAVREEDIDPVIIYSSTNEVYGATETIKVVEDTTRYRYADLPDGVDEETRLDFHSPYGYSKGAADQYVRDYHRIYGMRTVVFRQSCIYGPRQFGVEDQGWLAWFVIASVLGRPITIYGDGKQVRDVLYVDDLVDAYVKAVDNIDTTEGQVYNIGRGWGKSISVWAEFGPLLGQLLGSDLEVSFGDWRPGDQKVFISNISKAKQDFGWQPAVGVDDGIRRLYEWIATNRPLFSDF